MINIFSALAFPILMAAPPASPPSAAVPMPADSAHMTLVVVQNDRNVPVTVYGEDPNRDIKLGVVPPYSTLTLSLDRYLFTRTTMQFFVKPVGQIEESSGFMDMRPGERIGLVIPPRKS